MSIVPNDNETKEKTTGRDSGTGFLDQLENYVRGHDLIVKTPQGFLQGATFKLSPRNLDENELNMSVKLPAEDDSAAFEDRGMIRLFCLISSIAGTLLEPPCDPYQKIYINRDLNIKY